MTLPLFTWTRDEQTAIRLMLHGWPLRDLIASFDATVRYEIQSKHGCFGQDYDCEITRRGLEGDIEGRPVLVTWKRLRDWTEALPADVRAEAESIHAAWSRACRFADEKLPRPWQRPPSWDERTVYGPRTLTATLANEHEAMCDEVDRRDWALTDRLMPEEHEPADLLELAEMLAGVA